MTALIYHRRSKLDADPTIADTVLRAATAARGLALYSGPEAPDGIVRENGTGARNDRPGLNVVMGLAMRGAITHIVIWKIARFGRAALDVLSNVKKLKEVGVTLIATTEGLTVGKESDANSTMMLHILAGFAEWQRENILEGTELGLDAVREKLATRGSYVARRSGAVRERLGRPSALTPAQRSDASVLIAAGYSLRGAARKLGVSVSSLRRSLVRHSYSAPVPKTAPESGAAKPANAAEIPEAK